MYWHQAFWQIPHRFLLFFSYTFIAMINMNGNLFWYHIQHLINYIFLGINNIFSVLCLKVEHSFQKLILIGILFGYATTISAGYFVPIYETPTIFQLFAYLNPIRIQFESMILILFRQRCESIPILYNSYGINESQLSSNLYHLIIEGIIIRIIGFILLMFKSNSNFISILILIKIAFRNK